MTSSRVLSWSAVAFVVAGLALTALLEGRGDVTPRGGLADALIFVPGLLGTTAVGLVLSLRRPRNAVGWLLLVNGMVLVLSGLSDSYATYSYSRGDTHGLAGFAILWYSHGWPLIFAGVVAVGFVFPDGRLLPGRRYRLVACLGAAAFVTTTFGGLLGHDILDPPFSDVPPSRLLPQPVSTTLQSVGLLGMIATLILATVTLVLRFRRSHGVERAQMKWVALSGVLIPVAIVCGTVDGSLTEGTGLLTAIPVGAALAAIPVAIGIAVLRYRLYDIDRVISATVLYAVLSVLLGGAFLGIVVAGGVMLGRGSPLPTAAATVAVMLAFRPLRARLQRGADRRFNRARYDARLRLESFLDELRAGRAPPEAVGTAIAEAVGDLSLTVYFWFSDQGAHVDAAGVTADPLPADPPGRTPVLRGEDLLATVVHDVSAAARTGVLGEVILRAGLAIEVARLRVEVRRQLSEVEASRSRIVRAAQHERRRLERDLHDGAQQHLVSIGLDLRHLQRDMPPGHARGELDRAVRELGVAIRELRSLAQGVRPNELDAGLAPALTQLAARSTIRTEVDVTGDRFSTAIEAAAYFVASEALTNAVKHSGASVVTLTAAHENGQLRMVIADDGAGGAAPSAGSGLSGLEDRVAAVGGRLAVASRMGAGTRLEAVFPCG